MTKQNLIDQVNSELKEIDERLYIEYETEDLYGQDFEEYGIEDIEETRHFSLNLRTSESSATIIKEHFDFTHHRSLLLGRNAEDNLKFKGFTIQQNRQIEDVFLKYKR